MLYLIAILALGLAALLASNVADTIPTTTPATGEAKKPRKKREKKSMLTRLAEEAKRVANLKWDAAKTLMGRAGDRFQNIAEGRARLMRYRNESEILNDPAKVAEKVQNLEDRKARLLARAAIAAEYLPKVTAAVEKVDKVFASLGDAALSIITAGRDVEKVPEDEAVRLINAHLTPEDLAMLANATEDPYAAFRRAKTPENATEDAMPDATEDTVTEDSATEDAADEPDDDPDDDFSDDENADDDEG